MKLIALLFLLSCQSAPASRADEVTPPPAHLDIFDSLCDHDEKLGWFYIGSDGMIGWSDKSCIAAIREWKTSGSLPVMSRI